MEPTRNAETWINMLKVLNETGMAMEYNGGKVVEEAIRAMGIADLDQFKISKEQQQQPQTTAPQGGAGAQRQQQQQQHSS